MLESITSEILKNRKNPLNLSTVITVSEKVDVNRVLNENNDAFVKKIFNYYEHINKVCEKFYIRLRKKGTLTFSRGPWENVNFYHHPRLFIWNSMRFCEQLNSADKARKLQQITGKKIITRCTTVFFEISAREGAHRAIILTDDLGEPSVFIYK